MFRSTVVSLVILGAVVILFPLTHGKSGSKYSKEKNRVKEDSEIRQSHESGFAPGRKTSGHFRVARLETVWERAQKHLNIDEQRDIFDELKDIDEDEITLKKLRHEGGDKNGELTAKMRERLHDLLERYDLLTPLHAKSKTGNKKVQAVEKAKKTKTSKTESSGLELVFADKKLNKLWAKAKKAGFSEQELADLKIEFNHHQEKVDKYREPEAQEITEFNRFHGLADELSREERQDPSVGTAGKHWADIVQVDAGVKDVIKSYSQLKAKVNRHAFVPENGEFKESRVEDLWKQALQAGFDRDQLLSLREELSHFERKLDKLNTIRQSAATGKTAGDSQIKASDRSDDQVDVDQKLKHYSVKLDAIQQDIEHRINNRHNEL